MEIRQKILTRRMPPFKVTCDVTGTDTDRSATYDFLLVSTETMGLPRTVSVIKSDDCNILQSQPVYLTPLREFCYGSGARKTRMMPLPDRQKRLTIC